MTLTPAYLVEIVVALGLINVWLLRSGLATPFRGGAATTLKEEFRVYGLGDFIFWLVGTLKLGSAALLLAGPWFPMVTTPAASVIAVLMIGALGMHFKARDPAIKSIPAALMLALSIWIAFNSQP